MKRIVWLAPLVVGMLGLTGCKKNFPEPWDKYGFTRDNLVSGFVDSDGTLVGTYSNEAKVDDVVADWKKQLEAKGYKQFCEFTYDDKSTVKGMKGDKRYALIGGLLGKDMPEVSLMELPERMPDEEVCKKHDK